VLGSLGWGTSWTGAHLDARTSPTGTHMETRSARGFSRSPKSVAGGRSGASDLL
jgi:hypothetical protein